MITEGLARLLAQAVKAIRTDAYYQFRRQTGDSYEQAIEVAAIYSNASRSAAARRVKDAKIIYDFLEEHGYTRKAMGIDKESIENAIKMTGEVIRKRQEASASRAKQK
ncbi:MAG: hypothetical protein JJ896_14870 [Rhodothermales bacterium]|nr:hypothetical protein [Rhodothermales bacterium]MBO6780934.1 hypothetical protein [Rhodothermales bacterium]